MAEDLASIMRASGDSEKKTTANVLRGLMKFLEKEGIDPNSDPDEDCDEKYRRRHNISSNKLKGRDIFALSEEDPMADVEIDQLYRFPRKQIRRAFKHTYGNSDENSERPAYKMRKRDVPRGTRPINWDNIKRDKKKMLAAAALMGAHVLYRNGSNGKREYFLKETAFASALRSLEKQRKRDECRMEDILVEKLKVRLKAIKQAINDSMTEFVHETVTEVRGRGAAGEEEEE